LLRRRPAQQRIIANGILHIDDHPATGSTAESSSRPQHGLKKSAALPAVFFRDLDGHQAQVEELADDVLAEGARVMPFPARTAGSRSRANFRTVVWKHALFFAERGQRVIGSRYPSAGMVRY